MDSRKWLPRIPLFRAPACVYCGGLANSSDHTPPRCLLPKKLPGNVQAMTVPACTQCNCGFSADEMRVAAVVCTVSFTQNDREAVAPGGWVHCAMQSDSALHKFVKSRLGEDGIFRPDERVYQTVSRIMTKTAAGLLFHEFGRLIPLAELQILALEHAKNVLPATLVEIYRHDGGGWAEVTPSGRELERQVRALCGQEPRHRPGWRVYLREYFEYMFIRRSNNRLLTAMKLHDALTVLVECPWPARAGPRRKGCPPRPRR